MGSVLLVEVLPTAMVSSFSQEVALFFGFFREKKTDVASYTSADCMLFALCILSVAISPIFGGYDGIFGSLKNW